jgi:hypothetical protein
MGVAQLLEPVLTGGIKDTHFFNGRILTADDLRAMQVASRLQDAQLGRAVGDGVAFGLEVRLSGSITSTAEQPVVHVTRGLAINRRGEALELVNDIDLALIKDAQVDTTPSGAFVECPPPRAQTTLTNFGLYLLTVQPASQLEGHAPMTEISTAGVGSACGSRYAVAGVKFRLVRLELGTSTDSSPLRSSLVQLSSDLDAQLNQVSSTALGAALLSTEIRRKVSRLRNGVAHLCLGTDGHAAFVADPLARVDAVSSPYVKYGALDEMRDRADLTVCEVPLALMYWTRGGVQFVDQWAVRRSPVTAPRSIGWPVVAGDRRSVEGLSMFLQFQDQLDDLARSDASGGGGISAIAYFSLLPPIGILSTIGIQATSGFDPLSFFDSRTVRGPVYIEGANLAEMLQRATRFPPIDLAKRELIWLYRIRENIQGVESASVSRQVLVFTNGQMPFYGNPRFDLNYWNYANFA